MPYFNWQGVTLTGKTKRGKLFSRTQQELDITLFKRDIALLDCSVALPSWWPQSVSHSIKIQFFRQLAALLTSGVLLPDALIILTEQIDNPRFQEIIYAVANDVHQGASLGEAMHKYPQIFDPLMIHMVHVGHQAGALANAVDMLCQYLESVIAFRKKLRAASLMPILTLTFFCIISVVIFIGIIPRFKHIFDAAHHEIPYITRLLLNMSDILCGWLGIMMIGMLIGGYVAFKLYIRGASGKKKVETCMLWVPVIGDIVRYSNIMTMFRSMAMLLDAGMPLLFALHAARETVTNCVLQDQMQYLAHNVAGGSSLSQAMGQHPEQLFEQSVISMIHVGQESGQLSGMLTTVANRYQENVNRSLSVCTTLFQPLLMIILGLLVTGLVFAVYLPIFNLANIM